MSLPKLQAEVVLKIPFHDLDPLGIVWHGRYAKYFEIARMLLMQQMDYDIPQMQESGYIWPVIELNVRYVKPIRLHQQIIVQAELVEWENRLKIRYEIRDQLNGERLTRGHTIQVAVEAESGEMLWVCPAILADKINGLLL